MAKKRYISDSFWSDSYVEDLDPLEKYLFLYLLTNQQVSISGIYEIKLKRIAFETGIDKEMVEKMIKRFEENGKIFYIDGLIVITNFVKNQNIKKVEDNLWKGIEREVKELGTDKLDKLKENKPLIRSLQGAYKDLDIPYLTLLNLTKPYLMEVAINFQKKENKETVNTISFQEIFHKEIFENLEFIEKLKQKFSDEILKAERLKFISYWTEKNPNGKLERFQKEKTFDIRRRFLTWLSNSEKFSGKGKTTFSEKRKIAVCPF